MMMLNIATWIPFAILETITVTTKKAKGAKSAVFFSGVTYVLY